MSERKAVAEAAGRRARELVRQHVALTISAALVALSVMHIVVVAAFEPQTILALLSVADRTQVLISTVAIAAVTGGAAFLVGVLAGGLHQLRRIVHLPFHQQFVAMLAILTLTFFAVLQLPYVILVVFPFLVVAVLIARGRQRRADAPTTEAIRSDPIWARRMNLVLALALATALVGVLYLPWVPRENVGLKNDTTLVAYVIGSQDSSTMLLIDHQVLWVPTDRIASREVCEYSGNTDWVSARFRVGVDYPDCANQFWLRRALPRAGGQPMLIPASVGSD